MYVRALVLVFVVLNVSLFARKVTVSLSSMQQRAEIIVVATSLESTVVYKEKKVHFHLIKVLKGHFNEDTIVVNVPSLSFEKGVDYILFMNREDGDLNWIKGNSLRLKATTTNVANVKKEL